MSLASTQDISKEPPIKLGVRKGSIAAPIALLLLTILLFVVYGLPSGVDQMGASLGSDPFRRARS